MNTSRAVITLILFLMTGLSSTKAADPFEESRWAKGTAAQSPAAQAMARTRDAGQWHFVGTWSLSNGNTYDVFIDPDTFRDPVLTEFPVKRILHKYSERRSGHPEHNVMIARIQHDCVSQDRRRTLEAVWLMDDEITAYVRYNDDKTWVPFFGYVQHEDSAVQEIQRLACNINNYESFRRHQGPRRIR